ncbi:hypothetical protein D3C87_2075440 [compost metagenome]
MSKGSRVILRKDHEPDNAFLHQLQHQLVRFDIDAPPAQIIIQYFPWQAVFNFCKLLEFPV